MQNKKGSILIIALWILAILVVFALGLGQRTALNLRIAAHQKDKLKATFLARSGVQKAIYLLEKDAHNTIARGYDTRESCGLDLAGDKPENVFSQRWDQGKAGSFLIGYTDALGEFAYGFQDEESSVSIPKVMDSGQLALAEVFKANDVIDYNNAASSIFNWIDGGLKDGDVTFKKRDLRYPQELLAALEHFYAQTSADMKRSRRDARDNYNKLKNSTTIFARNLNLNTASEQALSTLTRAVAVSLGKDQGFAEKITQAVMTFRSSNPVVTQLDQVSASWEPAEKVFFDNSLKPYLSIKSDFFKFTVIGLYRNALKEIDLVYNRPDKRIEYWHEK